MPFERKIFPIQHQDPWYSRGYLPRCDNAEKIQSITFRLQDAVPADIVKEWRLELELAPRTTQSDPRAVELRRRLAKYEDQGHGECLLQNPTAANIVQDALLHFDGERYHLVAWCVMPNHVHVMFERLTFSLGSIAHMWKSYTAHAINKLLNRTGELWEREAFDRFIRNETHFHNVLNYIEQNPVAAGLVKSAADWKYSSAAFGRKDINNS